MSQAIGVLLLNLGGPESQEAVEPFLYNLFSDREIIQLPGGPFLQKPLARLIAKIRGPKVRANYRLIGGGSPILQLTRRQAAALEAALNEGGSGRFRVGIAMRYRLPSTADALEEMERAGVRRLVALTLYPQYSAATTGSSLNELRRVARRRAGATARVNTPEENDSGSIEYGETRITSIDRYPDHPGYLDALAGTVAEELERFSPGERREVVLLFSAHGLPMKFVEAGDPYVGEIARTRDGVLRVLRSRGIEQPWRLGYQSRTGPVPWIRPYTDEVIKELARDGVRAVLVVPIAFVSDHIETLYEVDLLFDALARRAGIREFRRCRMLNDDPIFIHALAGMVRRHLEEMP